MSEFFKKEWLKESEYPSIPKDYRICMGIDYAVEDYTCHYFWQNGEFHIQRLERNIK